MRGSVRSRAHCAGHLVLVSVVVCALNAAFWLPSGCPCQHHCQNACQSAFAVAREKNGASTVPVSHWSRGWEGFAPGDVHLPLLVAVGAVAVGAAAAVSAVRRGVPDRNARTVLICGVGYTGEQLAKRLLRDGCWHVLGTSRSAESRQRLNADMPRLRLFPNVTEALAAMEKEQLAVTHLIATAAPSDAGDPFLEELGAEAGKLLANIRLVAYMSTVGVYGDCGGDQIDETRALAPKSKRAQLRVQAEKSWANLVGDRLWIFRLPGIYGPGRGPLAKARSGEARRIVAGPGHVFSRIHVDDIVGSIVASIEAEQKAGGRPPWACNGGSSEPVVLNIVDDEPAAGHEVSGFAFELLGKEPPPCTDLDKADLSAIARSFYEESRYVLNTRLRGDLGYELLYPSFREGLRAQLQEEESARRAAALRAMPSTVLAGFRRLLDCSSRKAAPALVLVDNGSLKAESTLGLRKVAKALSEQLHVSGSPSASSTVFAASARFSDRVDPGELGGEKAWTVLSLLRKLRANRTQEVVLLPVFFGPSGMVTDFLPKQVASVQSDPGPPMPVISIAPTLICSCPFLFPNSNDNRIARILLDKIEEAVKTNEFGSAPAIAVVDHGSPSQAVARCRDQVTQQLTDLLKTSNGSCHGNLPLPSSLKPRAIKGCCMERREGPEYDFNGRLLEQLLEEDEDFHQGEVICALMFLQPGRHAGPDGDIAQILRKTTESRPKLRVVMTDTIGAHPLLVELLAERCGQAFRPAGW